jgi:hypothetical protein
MEPPLRQSGKDNFPTTPIALQLLYKFLKSGWTILEYTACKGNLAI